jgi:hypothetical protein
MALGFKCCNFSLPNRLFSSRYGEGGEPAGQIKIQQKTGLRATL